MIPPGKPDSSFIVGFPVVVVISLESVLKMTLKGRMKAGREVVNIV
jgi:hypothetical protein